MSKLDPVARLSITHDVVSQVLQPYAISDFSYEVCTQGIANTTVYIYIAGRPTYVLRAYAAGRKKDEEIRFELSFQDGLRECGIPVPHVLQNTAGNTLTICEVDGMRWQVILMDFVTGESKTVVYTPKLIGQLATLQAQMHMFGASLSPRSAGRMFGNELTDYYAVGYDATSYSAPTQAFIARAQAYRYTCATSLPQGYCHLDFDLDGNVIVQDGAVVGVIDFDDLSYAPLAVCLGYSLWNILHDEGSDAVVAYLACYESVRPLMSIEKETLVPVMQFRNYEIGALRLRRTCDEAVVARMLTMEAEIGRLIFK